MRTHSAAWWHAIAWPLPIAAMAAIAVLAAGCGGAAPATGSAPTGGQSSQTPGGGLPGGGGTGTSGKACALVSAADLASLGISGAGRPSSVTSGSYTTYSCVWSSTAGVLNVLFEPNFPAAATQVHNAAGQPVSGVGDAASGQFGTALDAVDFAKGTTYGTVSLLGSTLAPSKA